MRKPSAHISEQLLVVVSLCHRRVYLQVRVHVVRISIRFRRVRASPLLGQNRLYGSVELVFVHDYAGAQVFLLQTHVACVRSDGTGGAGGAAAGDGALCARLERHPAPVWKAA